jgi:hypothetical protein
MLGERDCRDHQPRPARGGGALSASCRAEEVGRSAMDRLVRERSVIPFPARREGLGLGGATVGSNGPKTTKDIKSSLRLVAAILRRSSNRPHVREMGSASDRAHRSAGCCPMFSAAGETGRHRSTVEIAKIGLRRGNVVHLATRGARAYVIYVVSAAMGQRRTTRHHSQGLLGHLDSSGALVLTPC